MLFPSVQHQPPYLGFYLHELLSFQRVWRRQGELINHEWVERLTVLLREAFDD